MYPFSRAAVTNYHKFSGLKQHKCIFSQFWRQEVKNQWARIKASAGPCSFSEVLEGNLPHLFQLLGAASIPWHLTASP